MEAKVEFQTLVKELIDTFNSKGLEITSANYGGYTKPVVIKKYKPDIIGWDNEKELHYFGTVSTSEDDLRTIETREKINEFSRLVMKNGVSQGRSCPYYIVVPKQFLGKLEQTLVDVGISLKDNIHPIGV